ncbi:30S ribosomal protein S2 [Candidatus Beckwithbacteria bacterium CG_4_10_14_0_2_um_filter_47_25]|uniref:Small ribosomal subunit protein uS2 n=2 Tax=Candidatus Beckwithiibacteriota TaxID=1752726 RepID=A0A1J4RNU6_9BACT|nr:MAG: 30S ribosomal protein S2 [Candidatus Beckwithbacteria bacterium CG1_02_47_37]PJA22472.1 MAG: 30S ribosomal protein S2 [Candidatus Beckwithbacteria bacterium CG_4_10_14_0_2_um_filter_47_25]
MTKTKIKVKKQPEYLISLEELLEAGCHFGHQGRRWNPKMKPYIYAKKEGVHIFDLEKTAAGLARAMVFVRDLVSEGKKIVFVGTKRQAAPIIAEEAVKAGLPFINMRWLGGTITNWEQIKKGITRLSELETKKQKGELKKYTKKENVLFNREIDKLNRFVGGLRSLTDLPAAIFVVDVKKEIAAVREARKTGISVVALVDSNTDPDLVDYVIPANDDAVRSIKLIVSKLAQAAQDGKANQPKAN